MSEQFTPGPWHLVGKLNVNGPVHPIAHAYFVRGEANARLIAAAPDLYRLVEGIEASLTADNSYRLLREACRAVLAKASGETSDA